VTRIGPVPGMGIKDEAGNAVHRVKGEAKEVAGQVVGSEGLEESGREEVDEARSGQADEVARQERKEGESPAEPSSTMEGVLHADGR
jgi:uncharacterized protein YjbJ (UPF0337 family)